MAPSKPIGMIPSAAAALASEKVLRAINGHLPFYLHASQRQTNIGLSRRMERAVRCVSRRWFWFWCSRQGFAELCSMPRAVSARGAVWRSAPLAD